VFVYLFVCLFVCCDQIGHDVKLKLYSNSTRRARWDIKLGFHTQPGPLHISLTSILPGGGNVSSVSVTVVRVYPLLYVEKLDEGKSGELVM
jgi:breast cancer 2 susceptibility protein